jgi:Protein of unknown function (DUF3606)
MREAMFCIEACNGPDAARQLAAVCIDISEENTMSDLKKKGQPDRSKINMHEAHEVKCWSHQLGVSRERLQQAVDKVGNAAAAVRKELA